jgi:hypothetical protein
MTIRFNKQQGQVEEKALSLQTRGHGLRADGWKVIKELVMIYRQMAQDSEVEV